MSSAIRARSVPLVLLGALLSPAVHQGCSKTHETSRAGDAASDGGARVFASCSADRDCNDGIGCTADRCVDQRCIATVRDDACGERLCDPRTGCVDTPACTRSEECADRDPCTNHALCDPSTHRCRYALLDADGDGLIPSECGGVDCEDSQSRIPAAGDADCDSFDSDCDGALDEDHDTRADATNCGSCGVGCLSGVCKAGECTRCGSDGDPCCSHRCAIGVRGPSGVMGALADRRIGDVNECSRVLAGEEACGEKGAPGVCVDDVCHDCGLAAQPCCPNDDGPLADGCDPQRGPAGGHIAPVLQCVSGRCERCGRRNTPCCRQGENTICAEAFPTTCVAGMCESCGSSGEACCLDDPPCTSATTCLEGKCTDCGRLRQRCCDDGVCVESPLECAGDVCVVRACGIAPPPPAEVSCSQEVASCLRACPTDDPKCHDACRHTLWADERSCEECLQAETLSCVAAHGCERAFAGARCCVVRSCPQEDPTRVLLGCPGCGTCAACAAAIAGWKGCTTRVAHKCADANLHDSGCLPPR